MFIIICVGIIQTAFEKDRVVVLFFQSALEKTLSHGVIRENEGREAGGSVAGACVRAGHWCWPSVCGARDTSSWAPVSISITARHIYSHTPLTCMCPYVRWHCLSPFDALVGCWPPCHASPQSYLHPATRGSLGTVSIDNLRAIYEGVM
jgi:hypothetical protein